MSGIWNIWVLPFPNRNICKLCGAGLFSPLCASFVIAPEPKPPPHSYPPVSTHQNPQSGSLRDIGERGGVRGLGGCVEKCPRGENMPFLFSLCLYAHKRIKKKPIVVYSNTDNSQKKCVKVLTRSRKKYILGV